jgi:hypothetical protein
MQTVWNQITQVVGAFIPNLIGALVILILGLIIAWIVSAVVRALLRRTTVDDRIARWITGEEDEKKPMEVEDTVGKVVFWLIMVFVLIAFFEALGLTAITQPLNRLLNTVFEYIPQILGAAVLLLLAWIIASAVRWLVVRGLDALNVDKRLGNSAGVEEERMPVTKSIGDALYWLVFLLFLPAILTALNLQGLLVPVQDMVDTVLGFLPNLFAAGLLLLVGWFVAKLVQRIVTNLLVGVGLDRLSERVGLKSAIGEQSLSELVGLLLYILILIPVIIASLNALQLEALTAPASNMLNKFLGALPHIFGAALLLIITYVIARLVAALITTLLAGVGFDTVLVRIGLAREKPGAGQRTPSEVVGYLVLVVIMLFAFIEAAALVGFAELATLLTGLTVFLWRVVLGLVIFGIGLWLGNLAGKAVEATGSANARLLALAARVAIWMLAGAMALSQLGLGSDIINLAFGLLLGAIAVAAALAFGLGGRELAGRQLERWQKSIESDGS